MSAARAVLFVFSLILASCANAVRLPLRMMPDCPFVAALLNWSAPAIWIISQPQVLTVRMACGLFIPIPVNW